MTQLSRYPVSKKVYDLIFDNFCWLIASLNKQQDVEIFIRDFLTKTEKLMLAKRIMIALLIEQGYSYDDIMQILKVSPSTIAKIQQLLESSQGYKIALMKLNRKQEMKIFWQEIKKILLTFAKGYKVYG